MMSASLPQILDLWCQLEAAYHGTSTVGSYDGHETEVSLTRLVGHDMLLAQPIQHGSAGIIARAQRQAELDAGRALLAIIEAFIQRRRDAQVTLSGLEHGAPAVAWTDVKPEAIFCHRVGVPCWSISVQVHRC